MDDQAVFPQGHHKKIETVFVITLSPAGERDLSVVGREREREKQATLIVTKESELVD